MKTEKATNAVSHTPGPWEVQKDGRNIVAVGPVKAFILEALDYRNGGGSEFHSIETTANAYLAAAAPDLLKAAEMVFNIEETTAESRDFPTAEQWSEIVKISRAAIARAEGR
ncbi:MAG: hypothetical protein KGJ13_09880 [Patescibacteria group bacterium]|nr:hypothetical protein [Patescibacteria group bacterium]